MYVSSNHLNHQLKGSSSCLTFRHVHVFWGATLEDTTEWGRLSLFVFCASKPLILLTCAKSAE